MQLPFIWLLLILDSFFIDSIETNDSENNSELINEVVIEGINENVLTDIFLKYNPNANHLDQQFQTVFADYIKNQMNFDKQLT